MGGGTQWESFSYLFIFVGEQDFEGHSMTHLFCLFGFVSWKALILNSSHVLSAFLLSVRPTRETQSIGTADLGLESLHL